MITELPRRYTILHGRLACIMIMMMNNNGYLILDKPIWYVITCIIILTPVKYQVSFCTKTYNMLFSRVKRSLLLWLHNESHLLQQKSI